MGKFDVAGELLWTRQLGTSRQDTGYGVATDAQGNVYVSGATDGNLGGAGAGSADVFFGKYDAEGNLLWTRQFGTPAADISYSVAVDSPGNIYLAGATYGSLDGSNAGDRDAFVSKLDPAGDLLWLEQLGTPSYDGISDMTLDHLGNVYISGYTLGSLAGPNAGGEDVFVGKFDAAGNLLWATQFGSPDSEANTCLAVDHQGNIYASGAVNVDRRWDVFVTKLVVPEPSTLGLLIAAGLGLLACVRRGQRESIRRRARLS